ncbi:MAG: 4-hydroxy-tetrahydrodipicolinate reductase [Candidatus Adiutrix sp.]|nr:4-hydroxy-tetrahydrodipicolinate reductase [Candidatus Adiutrix sp.]
MTTDSAINIAVCGAVGRMGRRVIQTVLADRSLRLSGIIERPDCPLVGQNLNQAIGGGAPSELILTSSFAEGTAGADVYIDFTTVPAGLAYLELAAARKLAAVIGTTGFSPADQERLKEAGRAIPVLWAPNMSLGVSAMYKVVSELARALGPDYDVEIVELHHRRKQDAPSGTALKLAQAVARARGLDQEKSLVTGRRGQVGPRSDGEIGVMAGRGGDVVGDHTVYFLGPGERLEITHRAHTRDTFAQGAVRVAAWLAGRAPGLYTLEDTLGQ